MRAIALACLLPIGAAGAGAGRAGGEDPRPPNVVLLYVDDLGWSDLPSYGNTYHETPHLDRLAQDGVRFAQAYAPAPNCSPSRAGLLTGRWPARSGLTQFLPAPRPVGRTLVEPRGPDGLPQEETTIAEVLRERGYATASIGKWHLGGRGSLPEDHGFDLNFGGGANGRHRKLFAPYELPAVPAQPGEYLTDRLTRRALRFISDHRDGPFLLYLSYYAVHEPIGGKPEHVEAFRRREPGPHHANPEYAAMIRSVDDSVGRIRARLEELGLAERTVLLFSSDNGGAEPHTSNHPLRAGKGFLYEGGVRVPLVACAPGTSAGGRVSEAPVTGLDLFATILDLAGADPLPSDGASLVPLLAGGKGSARDLFWHYPHYSSLGSAPCGAIRRGDLKLIEFFEDGRVELYDLAADPGEANDLSGTRGEEARELLEALRAWRATVGARMPRAR